MERIHPWEIHFYQTISGKIPFQEWLESLDLPIQARIKTRLDRVRMGNFGDSKSIGESVFEMRIHYGGGYRIYFGTNRNAIVLLLCGGNKDSQTNDIAKAKAYWQKYKESSA